MPLLIFELARDGGFELLAFELLGFVKAISDDMALVAFDAFESVCFFDSFDDLPPFLSFVAPFLSLVAFPFALGSHFDL